jgi:hypothetical protein
MCLVESLKVCPGEAEVNAGLLVYRTVELAGLGRSPLGSVKQAIGER